MFTDHAPAGTARRERAEGRPVRYGFDRNLARSGEPDEHPDHAAALAAARAEAHAAGHAAGQASAEAAAARAGAEALAAIAATAAALLAKADTTLAVLRREAVEVAVATAESLSRHLVARHPLAEIEALLADCLGPLGQVPHLVIRLRPDDVDAIRARAHVLAAEHGFAGRLVVLGEPDFGPGDCRIEWADGGIVRDFGRAAAGIAAAVATRFPAPREEADAAPPPRSEPA